MRILFFLLFICLFGCGKKFDTVDDVEPLFKTTTNKNTFLDETMEFFALENLTSLQKKSVQIEADSVMNSIPINLYDVKTLYKSQGFVAVCRKSSKSGRKEILVDQDFWNKNPNLRKTLIMHELGHCRLGREHQEAKGGCRSIMEATLITIYNSLDPRVKSYFANELFKKPNPCTPLEKYIIP